MFNFKIMKYSLILLFFLLSKCLFSQTNKLSTEYFVGKWQSCSETTINNEKYNLDTAKNCTGEWNIEFFADGTYIRNNKLICNSLEMEDTGTWTFDGTSVTLQSNNKCRSIISPPFALDNIILINQNKWYREGVEGKIKKKTIYYHEYFIRI